MALGCIGTIRNPAAHLAAHDAGELAEQEAFEQLATLSTLARFLDECELETADDACRSPGMVYDPELVVLDEPAIGLDLAGCRCVRDVTVTEPSIEDLVRTLYQADLDEPRRL